jgi:branched-subunit amino acid aminotransferase/4-amino-4-deoxychorismate lyase
MVKFGKTYQDLGEDYYLAQHRARHLARLRKQAKRLGFTLVPETASANESLAA